MTKSVDTIKLRGKKRQKTEVTTSSTGEEIGKKVKDEKIQALNWQKDIGTPPPAVQTPLASPDIPASMKAYSSAFQKENEVVQNELELQLHKNRPGTGEESYRRQHEDWFRLDDNPIGQYLKKLSSEVKKANARLKDLHRRIPLDHQADETVTIKTTAQIMPADQGVTLVDNQAPARQIPVAVKAGLAGPVGPNGASVTADMHDLELQAKLHPVSKQVAHELEIEYAPKARNRGRSLYPSDRVGPGGTFNPFG